ncbi:FAD dependent oxidoreductase [Myriangium duriaei CBS 260.36]|uniref:FAD dependent oxidoreductase n=1 Tax=Myriangium duriaei CBS 260.36 TaxID=1168546 RepID=A0A9P4J799_9PEZI|nr:FAD dependent oxidoreductase [Myriangium duriaei CBS 260.36]
MAKPSRQEPVLIVGAGVFGLSTAHALIQRGYSNITIIDRHAPPVIDGSSNDISRVIRADYNDPFYSRLANEAIGLWKSSEIFSPHYYHSGILQTSEDPDDPYLERNKDVLRAQSLSYVEFNDTKELRQGIPALEDIMEPRSGYLNPEGGWADAAGAILALAHHLKPHVKFTTGPQGTVQSLIVNNKSEVEGVKVLSGPPIYASKVILATGAWTNRYVDLDHAIIGSAQPLGCVQLSAEEAEHLAKVPVTMDLTRGVFFFPPTADKVLKVAYHGHGFEMETPHDSKEGQLMSAPLRDANNAASLLPHDADQYLRFGLQQLVPFAANKPWIRQRLCWYTETPTGDFIADYHHSMKGLFIATGGSGHGFKFLPVLGRYIADCFEGIASPEVRERWKLNAPIGKEGKIAVHDGSRRGPPRRVIHEDERSRLINKEPTSAKTSGVRCRL